MILFGIFEFLVEWLQVPFMEIVLVPTWFFFFLGGGGHYGTSTGKHRF